jgi:uncharacterized protein YjiS (DUF1127 family)
MLLKLNAVAAKPHLQVNQVWSAAAAYFRQQRERSRDRRILRNMNDHDLRDLGLSRSQRSTYHRS